MHITILALGSRGDVSPYLTLGKALKATGHRVRCATFENFEPLVTAQGLDFHPVQGDVQGILSGPGGQTLAESGRSALRMARSVRRLFTVMAEGFAHDFSSPSLWDTDLIVNQLPGGLYGYDLAEKLDIPMILAAVMPLTPTKHQPMLAFPASLARLPGYNAFTHWLAYQLVRLFALGVGPKPIPHKKLSAERLARALSTATTDTRIRQRAAELGQKIRAEDGVQEAVRIIQQYAH